MNYFEVFGFDRRLTVDLAALQARFYELSRQWHPDYQQEGTPEVQAEALRRSALLNAAYRALREPIARVEYLVRLEEGRETREGAVVKPKAPPELLEEMFEVQEALAEARAGGLAPESQAALAEQRDRLAARCAATEAELAGPLAAAWDVADAGERPQVLERLKDRLATRAYLRTVVDDLSAALDETPDTDRERNVAHHRH